METIDLSTTKVRDLNEILQGHRGDPGGPYEVMNPMGAHALAAGLQHPISVAIKGHAGYYCAGMNKQAEVVIEGNAGTGVAENMMSGVVRVKGDASQSAGATGHGGLLIVEGNTSARCGISMKGIDIVVGGSVGHMSAFMAQAGNLVVCGDAGGYLGDSLYEANIFVAGEVESLGADCIEKEMTPEHLETLTNLLERAGMTADPGSFRRFGSARKLYNFNIDHAGSY